MVATIPVLPTHSTTTSYGPSSSAVDGSMTAVAPRSTAAWRRPSAGSETTISRTPMRSAHSVTASPTGPAPITSTRSSGERRARFTACSPTAIGSTSAPVSSGTASPKTHDSAALTRTSSANAPGPPPTPRSCACGHRAGSPARQSRQVPHAITGSATAAVPSGHASATSGPAATTSPTNSCPMIAPSGMYGAIFRSDPQMPTAATRRTRWPACATGSSTSRTTMDPCSMTAARTPHLTTRRSGCRETAGRSWRRPQVGCARGCPERTTWCQRYARIVCMFDTAMEREAVDDAVSCADALVASIAEERRVLR